MLGQRGRELVKEPIRQVARRRRGRHDAGRRHHILTVGEWLLDPGFAEQLDSRAELPSASIAFGPHGTTTAS
jgi:hypothetical protein